jgi:hypothetical protein
MTRTHRSTFALPLLALAAALAAAAPAEAQVVRRLDFGLVVGGDAQGIDADEGIRPHLALGRLDLSNLPHEERGLAVPDGLIRQIDSARLPFQGSGTRLETDYYRFGIGIGTARPTGVANLSWFSYAGAAADIIRSGLVGAESGQLAGLSGPVSAAVGGGRQTMAPRLSLYAGLNHEPAPGVSTFVALTASAAPHSAALPSQGPVSLGAVFGFNLRF